MAVFAAALVLRLGTQWLVGFYRDPVRWEYDDIARNVAEGRGYYHDFLGTRWQTFGLPALPLLDATMYVLSGGTDSYYAIGVVLAAMSAGTAAVGTIVATRLHCLPTGALVGTLLVFHPGALVYAAEIMELPIETFALALALVAFLNELQRPSRRSLLAMMACASLAIFVRPTYAGFVIVALGVLIIRRRATWRRAVLVLLAVLIATTPWTIRNALVLNGPQSTIGPYSCLAIWMGNNPYAPGSTIAADGRSWWDVQPADVKIEIFGRPEAQQGRIMCEQAKSFLSADPLHSLRWWATKWSWYWWVSPQAGQIYPQASLRAYLVLWAIAATLGFVGVVVLLRTGRRWELAILIALVVPISLAQSFVYVDGRHRIEIEWAIMVLSGIGLVASLQRVLGRRWT